MIRKPLCFRNMHSVLCTGAKLRQAPENSSEYTSVYLAPRK